MNMNDLIIKKRDGGRLNEEEIRYFVEGYTGGVIPDYQASALLMAVYFNGLDHDETVIMTKVMRDSGDVVNLSEIPGIKVDKHSTGGVGDKTTLIAGPLTAACGVPVAKMSGRGLGFTGGTVDKLESIRGFRTAVDEDDFHSQIKEIGIAVTGQTAHVAPADKKIYALRDVTGTVDCLGLIASSVMSKKLASGSDAILLDVKCGDGAFMEDIESAEELAKLMCEIGNADGKPTAAVITDMNQPLGNAVGNSLEVIEAVETLKGRGPEDITELSVFLAGCMIFLGGKARSREDGVRMAREALNSGRGLSKLEEMIGRQGGDTGVISDYSLFGEALCRADLVADASLAGYIYQIKARTIGIASQQLGAGRTRKEDSVDMNAGIYLHKKVGDEVREGDVIATLYSDDEEKLKAGLEKASSAFVISTEPAARPEVIKRVIGI